MELKPGYKQTEVGVIPEDWGMALLDTVAKRGSGHTPNKKHPEYWGGQIKWISLQDSDRLDRLYIDDTAATITPAGIANSSATMHPAGTVVMSRDAGVGKSAIMKDNMAVSQHFMAWKCGLSLDNHFLYYWLQSKKPEFERIAMGNTIKTIGLPYFKQLVCPLPTTAEQEAIAKALCDADALIESLEQLIAKKRHLKQGAMQQLLTGKKRLPGFSAEWGLTTFGETFDYHSTATNSRSDLSDAGDTYYIHYGDIHTRFHNHLNFRIVQPPRIERNRCKNAALLQTGDWIMVDASEDFDGVSKSIEIVGLDDGVPAVAGLHTFLLREKCPTFALGFKGHLGNLKSLHEQFLRVATGMKVFGVSKTALKDLTLPVPSREEQAAIAAVLSDMDAEIAALEAKLVKARQIKLGTMHNLLTGRIRLV